VVQPPVGPVALVVETPVDAIAAMIETVRKAIPARTLTGAMRWHSYSVKFGPLTRAISEQ